RRNVPTRMPIPSDVRIFGWTRVWSAQWTAPRTACCQVANDIWARPPTEELSRPGSGDDDCVTPQQTAVTCRVGTVVGDSDMPGLADCGLRQRCGEVP